MTDARVHEVTSLVGEKREFPALLHHLHRSSGHCSSARTRCARASVDRNPRERTNERTKRCNRIDASSIHPSIHARARTRTARKATTSSGHDSSSFVSFVSSPRALGRVGVDECRRRARSMRARASKVTTWRFRVHRRGVDGERSRRRQRRTDGRWRSRRRRRRRGRRGRRRRVLDAWFPLERSRRDARAR